MTLLYALSILHVMLEFPLNHNITGIGRELRAMTSYRRHLAQE